MFITLLLMPVLLNLEIGNCCTLTELFQKKVFLHNSNGCQANQPFNAAVVEYYPIQDTKISPSERLLNNSNAYISILSEVASHQELDIIVFPESTLTTNGPIIARVDILPYSVEIQDEFDLKSLCNKENFPQTSLFLTNLACAAKKFSTYLVVNLVERSPCKNDRRQQCSDDGWDFYNTNVVFDRNGAVISKYRKFNLFGEYYFNQTATPDFSMFETDFGVTFGMFTCFDILFKSPTLQLIREYGIKHIIYPTMWFSELPFLTALQAQQQWAFEVDAVFLVAGANNAKLGSGGTGIYQGRSNSLIFDITQKKNSKAYVSKISNAASNLPEVTYDTQQIDEMARDMDTFYFKTDDLTSYTSAPLTHSEKINEVLCSDDGVTKLCCSFNLDLKWDSNILEDNKNHYNYRMVAFSGVRSFSGVYNGGVEICGIVACINESINSCNTRFKNYDTITWPATFNKISITSNFTEDNNRIQFPNSLLSSIRPLPVHAIEWSTQHFMNRSIKQRVYKLKKPQNRLMTFAIYGRNFLNDGPP